MTWLFTQVWLWSLAAFVVSSLINWLLFVLPLRRRLRALADEYADYAAEVEERFAEQEFAEPQRDEPQRDDSAMDLLPTDVDAPADAGAQRGVDDPDELTVGDWHRSPRAWMPGGGGADATGAAGTARLQPSSTTDPSAGRGPEQSAAPRSPQSRTPGPQVPQRPESPRQREGAQHERGAVGQAPESFGAERSSVVPADETDLRMEEQRERTEGHETFRVTPIAPPPSAPAELSFDPPEPAAPAAPGRAVPENREGWSSWFQEGGADGSEEERFARATAFDPPEPSGTESRSAAVPDPESDEPRSADPAETDPADPAGTEPRAEGTGPGEEDTDLVRPLFRPRNTPASRPEPASAQGADGAQEGLGNEAPATGAEPELSTTGEASTESPEDAVLPRRTPGHGPRPGRQNLNRLRKEAESRGHEHSAPAAADDALGEVGAPAGADSPETAQADDRSAREGKMVKGHFASRQYHTPDSPQYDRVVAEVWFRSAADAEQAGFEPWHGNQNLN